MALTDHDRRTGLTEAQYLAAARALLGLKGAYPASFIRHHVASVSPEENFRAALAVAFEAGRATALADHEVTHEWGTRFHFGNREPITSSAANCDEPEVQARFRARLNGLRADRTEVVRRDRLVGPWEAQP